MKIYRRTLTFSDWCISWDRPTALIQNFKFQSFKYGLEIQNKVYLSHILQPSPGWLALLGSFTPSSSVGSGSIRSFRPGGTGEVEARKVSWGPQDTGLVGVSGRLPSQVRQTWRFSGGAPRSAGTTWASATGPALPGREPLPSWGASSAVMGAGS